MFKAYIAGLLILAAIYTVKKVSSDARIVYHAIKSGRVDEVYNFPRTDEIKKPKMPRYTNPAIYDEDY